MAACRMCNNIKCRATYIFQFPIYLIYGKAGRTKKLNQPRMQYPRFGN